MGVSMRRESRGPDETARREKDNSINATEGSFGRTSVNMPRQMFRSRVAPFAVGALEQRGSRVVVSTAFRHGGDIVRRGPNCRCGIQPVVHGRVFHRARPARGNSTRSRKDKSRERWRWEEAGWGDCEADCVAR